MLEGTLFGKLSGRVNHVEPHHRLAVGERRFHMINHCCAFEDTLGFFRQAQIGADYFCFWILLLESFL